MLTAMSIVMGMFCKTFFNLGPGLRITFEGLPIVLAGIFLGPISGAFVGLAGDLISYFLSPQILHPDLIVTMGAMSLGLVSGLIAKFIVKKRGYLQIITSGLGGHLIGSVIIKTAGLFVHYKWIVLLRIPLYLLLIVPLEILLLCLLYKNKSFRKLLEKL